MMNIVRNLVRRKISFSPVKYFNQRLLNYSQKFASDTDYIFFACNILQSLNAGVLNNSCFNETFKQWASKDQVFMFISSIKGTPSYWGKNLSQRF